MVEDELNWSERESESEILFDLCQYLSLPNVNTQLGNLCIHSKRYRFRSNINAA